MRSRPSVRCFVSRLDKQGIPVNIELVDLSTAAVRREQGWAVIGPDPHDEIELDAWIQETAWFTSEPGDNDV